MLQTHGVRMRTYCAISSFCADHWSLWAWNIAAILCSSVMALLICVMPPVFDAVFVLDLLAGCSFREVFFAVTGILPDMYLAALPAPGLIGGSRRAMIDVERGMIVVSSSYSTRRLVH
jgi:hypothetical protein